MPWTYEICLRLGRDLKGAIVWGALEAQNQWTSPVNPDHPNVKRPTDREIVDAVRDKAMSAAMLQAFAKEYRVFHYPLSLKQGLEERLTKIAAKLDEIYRGPLDTGETLAGLWWQGVEAVRDVIVDGGIPATHLRSFCMKVLWFYQPQAATMWDAYALSGLNAQCGTHHPAAIKTAEEASAFLTDFEQLFASVKTKIDEVLSIIGDGEDGRYRYDRRVLDKALWLIGAKEDVRVIKMMYRMWADAFSRGKMEQFLPELRG